MDERVYSLNRLQYVKNHRLKLDPLDLDWGLDYWNWLHDMRSVCICLIISLLITYVTIFIQVVKFQETTRNTGNILKFLYSYTRRD